MSCFRWKQKRCLINTFNVIYFRIINQTDIEQDNNISILHIISKNAFKMTPFSYMPRSTFSLLFLHQITLNQKIHLVSKLCFIGTKMKNNFSFFRIKRPLINMSSQMQSSSYCCLPNYMELFSAVLELRVCLTNPIQPGPAN